MSDRLVTQPLTAAELAAFLGMSAAGVRQIVRRHRIPPVARWGRAKVYDPAVVIAVAGPHDRRTPQV